MNISTFTYVPMLWRIGYINLDKHVYDVDFQGGLYFNMYDKELYPDNMIFRCTVSYDNGNILQWLEDIIGFENCGWRLAYIANKTRQEQDPTYQFYFKEFDHATAFNLKFYRNNNTGHRYVRP